MKITQILEAKKGVKSPKYAVKPRNFVAKNAIASGAGAHKDKKKAEKQGDVKHKGRELAEASESPSTIQQIATKVGDALSNALPQEMRPFDNQTAANNVAKYKQSQTKEEFNGEYDDEAGMVDNNLETMKRAVNGLDSLIHKGDNLPEWCQEKIAVAKSMLVAVWDYMASEEQGVAEAGNNPLEKSRFGMGDTRTPRDIKSQMSGASDEFVKSTADKNTGPFHSKVAKMQGKMAKSELRRREQGVAEGSNEKSDTYRAGYQNARRTSLSGKPIESKLSGQPDYKAGYNQGVADHKAWENEHNNKEQGVAEGFFGIDDKIKGKIQNVVSDLSDIPGMWDHKAQTFTDAGMDKLKTVLKNNPKYIKYALNLDYRDYEAEGVVEDSDPCWKDYKQVGMKKKGNKQVPNCVPKESIENTSEAMYRRPGSPSAYDRDYTSSVSGMGRKDSYAYQQDGGANDEGEDDTPYQAPQDKPVLQGYYFYNVPSGKEQEAASYGIKQTKTGKWAKAKYSTSGRSFDMQKDMADKAFGPGKYWQPK